MNSFINTLIILSTTLLFFLIVQLIIILFKKISKGNIDIALDGNKIIIKPNKNLVISARITYVELENRKICLPFDENYDSISEVYNSFYSCFGILRELLKNLDLSKKNSEAKLYSQIKDFINNVLRNHLTIHQKIYREWLNKKTKEDKYINEIIQQKEYEKYAEIISGIKEINIKANKLKDELYKIAFGVNKKRRVKHD